MPCVLKVSWLIVDGLHVPEEEDGVIRSLASCWTCTSRAPLQASAQTELLCSWIPHGPPSCKQGEHNQLSQSSTAQSVKQKQARAHVKPNPNPLMLTLCFFFFYSTFSSSGVISHLSGSRNVPLPAASVCAHPHTVALKLWISHISSRFSTIRANPSLLPEAPGNHHSHSITGIIANLQIILFQILSSASWIN